VEIMSDNLLPSHFSTFTRNQLISARDSEFTKLKGGARSNALFRSLDNALLAHKFSPTEPRVEPVAIYIHGEPGTGKSMLAYYIINQLCKLYGRSFCPGSDLYVPDPISEFWDGYCGQFVTLFDDYGQCREPTILAREFMRVIRVVNNIPLPLNMSDLSSKSNVYFTSPIVIFTSNASIYTLFRPMNHFFSDLRAIYRRFHSILKLSTPFVEYSGTTLFFNIADDVGRVISDLPSYVSTIYHCHSRHLRRVKELKESLDATDDTLLCIRRLYL
jgi:hypothetical protein